MRARLLVTLFALFAAQSVALAQSKLHLKTFTASPGGFAVNSTLVYGDKDAILSDARFAQGDAHRLVAEIIETGKNLTTVYVTHAHPDHYFGFGVIKQAFPDARIVALPAVVKDIQATAEPKFKQWKPVFGNNVTANPIIPEPLAGTALTLEGETLQIVGGVQGDTLDSSYVWIPSLNAVVVGDIAFSGIYPWTAETTPALRKEWIKALDEITARNPAVVVAGHKKAGAQRRCLQPVLYTGLSRLLRSGAGVVEKSRRAEQEDQSEISGPQPRRHSENRVGRGIRRTEIAAEGCCRCNVINDFGHGRINLTSDHEEV